MTYKIRVYIFKNDFLKHGEDFKTCYCYINLVF